MKSAILPLPPLLSRENENFHAREISGRRLFIVYRRVNMESSRAGVGCRVWKSDFTDEMAMFPGLSHRKIIMRVPRNNACARIYGRRGWECVRDSGHHKSIMAISAAIKSLRLWIGWIRNRIVLTYVNRSASSFLFLFLFYTSSVSLFIVFFASCFFFFNSFVLFVMLVYQVVFKLWFWSSCNVI